MTDLVNDGTLHGFDGDRGLIDAQHAAAFTGSRAYAACELWEVVGVQQAVQSFLPPALVHQVVPLWYQVAQRTSCKVASSHLSAGRLSIKGMHPCCLRCQHQARSCFYAKGTT